MTYGLTEGELARLKSSLHWLIGYGEGALSSGVLARAKEIQALIREVESRGDVYDEERIEKEP